MSRHAYLIAIPIAAGLLAWALTDRPAPDAGRTADPPTAAAVAPALAGRLPTLYCEFNNFADLTPLVGYFFRADAQAATSFALVLRRERDGTETAPEQSDLPRSGWALDTADNPAVLRAPDGETSINLYRDGPAGSGTGWFEAGLRSIRYRNLGGRCRRGA